MIVYVESNFVLEIALGQEQTKSAEDILTLAEEQKLELTIPAFALSEPFATVMQRGRERVRLGHALTEQLRQLQRSKPHQEAVAALQPAPIQLAEIQKREWSLLESTVRRLLRVGRLVQLTDRLFDQALTYEVRYGLSAQDAIIFSSVVTDL